MPNILGGNRLVLFKRGLECSRDSLKWSPVLPWKVVKEVKEEWNNPIAETVVSREHFSFFLLGPWLDYSFQPALKLDVNMWLGSFSGLWAKHYMLLAGLAYKSLPCDLLCPFSSQAECWERKGCRGGQSSKIEGAKISVDIIISPRAVSSDFILKRNKRLRG